MTPGRIVIIVALLALLTASGAFAFKIWADLADVDIGIHGIIAASLGIFFSLLIGCGLMALLFISARQGYDEAAARTQQTTAAELAPDPQDEQE